ncbi:heterodisulfide reductase subunit B [Tindallia magadiensis]|uniref:Heterodisulfide reductase subunit B n=1 Tax=Tindallia magadiensis TaxID=69895 RepID=A0A1I3BAT5_9FIRM|nr:CoB--CoM heterodisulfide reductase iron-sulfur subunit B family protein [Tindallia magadiensis]SFH59425.1 heterodisulfide reductase subunit B [Tindallia magadiensis]
MLGYYPGCTVRAQKEDGFEQESLAILAALGIEAKELKEWECCGAVYPLAQDEYVGLLASVRALVQTEEEQQEGLLTLCSACYHVLKRVNYRMKNDEEAQKRVGNYLETEYQGQTKVLHLMEVLRDYVGMKKLKEMVTKPLEGEKIASYYGCLFLRPQKEINLVDGENPQLMEEIVRALGAETVTYPYSTDCCGSYHTCQEEGVSRQMSLKLVESAKRAGATQMITACPLCKYNLEKCQEKIEAADRLPINYMTVPIVEAMGGMEALERKGEAYAHSAENSSQSTA